MASLAQLTDQTKEFAKGLSGRQWLLLSLGAVATVAVLFAFVRLTAKPDFKPLLTGMEPAEAQSVATRLAEKKIPYEISSDGKSISVPQENLDAARLEIAAHGMPQSGRLGFEIFDKFAWGQTEFNEKVNYQRALEGELERTIQTLSDVDSARVHLVMATDSIFIDKEREAKASVILKLRSGQLSPQTQKAITQLVAGAVDNLKPENVTVVDADTNRAFNPAQQEGLPGNPALEEQLTSKLMNTLEPIVGPKNVKANVRVEYEMGTADESREVYDPKGAVAVTTQKSEEMAGAGNSGGVPGTTSNVPGATGATSATAASDAQSSRSESATYAVSKTVRHEIEPAGRVRRISAAVLLDDVTEMKQENGKQIESRRKRTPEELKQIEQVASAVIGLDSTRGDVISVQNMPFEHAPAAAPADIKPNKVQKVQEFVRDWSVAVRYATIVLIFLIVYLLMLRPVKKQFLTAFKEVAEQRKLAAAAQAKLQETSMPQLSGAQQETVNLKKQIAEKIKADPAGTSRLVRGWLREEPQ